MTMPPLFSQEPRQSKTGKRMERGLVLPWDKRIKPTAAAS